MEFEVGQLVRVSARTSRGVAHPGRIAVVQEVQPNRFEPSNTLYAVAADGEARLFYGRELEPVPAEGMPCVIRAAAGRLKSEVMRVITPRRIVVWYDGRETVWSLRRDGLWRPKGADRSGGVSLLLGAAETHRDQPI